MSGWVVFIAWNSVIVTVICRICSGSIYDECLELALTKKECRNIKKLRKQKYNKILCALIEYFRFDTMKYVDWYHCIENTLCSVVLIIQIIIAIWNTVRIFIVGTAPQDPMYYRTSANGIVTYSSLLTSGFLIFVHQIKAILRKILEWTSGKKQIW